MGTRHHKIKKRDQVRFMLIDIRRCATSVNETQLTSHISLKVNPCRSKYGHQDEALPLAEQQALKVTSVKLFNHEKQMS